MTIEATRRAVLAGVPAAAVAVAIPATAFAASNEAWERAKADFTTATARMERAQLASNRVDNERTDFCKTAPEREVTVTEDGWAVITDDMHIEAKPRTRFMVLNDLNFDDEIIRKVFAGTAGYAAFGVELAASRNRLNALALERGWSVVDEEWGEACNAQIAAWKVLVACPVASAQHIAEKVELAQAVPIEDEEAARLLEAITADLRRITAS